MGAIWSRLWSVVVGIFTCELTVPGCYTRNTMDAFARLLGESRFDPRQAYRLHQCLERYSTAGLDLNKVSDAAWSGFVALGEIGANDWGRDGVWAEYNPTPLPPIQAIDSDENVTRIIIAEPCGAVSNFAYFRAAMEICDRLGDTAQTKATVETFMHLGFGSTFFHSAVTSSSQQADTRSIDVLALLLHQIAVSSLPYDSILFDISEGQEAPAETGLELANRLSRVYLEEAPASWGASLAALDMPRFELSFSAFMGVAFNIVFGADKATDLMTMVWTVLLGGSALDFVATILGPATRDAVADIRVPLLVRADVLLKLMGILLKLGHAFLWQEERISEEIPPIANVFSSFLIVEVNALANSLTRYNREHSIQVATHVYPGDSQCRRQPFPHTKWHEISANALVDYFLLTRDVDRALRDANGDEGRSEFSSSSGSVTFGQCQIVSSPERDSKEDDDAAIVEFSNCVIASTPALACVQGCAEQFGLANMGGCVVECVVEFVV